MREVYEGRLKESGRYLDGETCGLHVHARDARAAVPCAVCGVLCVALGQPLGVAALRHTHLLVQQRLPAHDKEKVRQEVEMSSLSKLGLQQRVLLMIERDGFE